MRLANLRGRAVLIPGDTTVSGDTTVDVNGANASRVPAGPQGVAIDVAAASGGRFGADPQGLFAEWDAFRSWAASLDPAQGKPFALDELGPPVPRPRQVFAIGINYAAHASEAGYPPDSAPVTFTKFPGCLAGPVCAVELPSGTVDWEVEMVVAVSRETVRVRREDAWDHVAGITLGQDLSERTSQLAGAKPQFSLAKSFPNFGPTGPWLVTPDEFDDPSDLAISCSLSGETMQSARTSAMIYDVPELLVRLSRVCRLFPGDLIFTGTPSGVGNARSPKRFIRPGEVLVSELEGVGRLTQRFSAAAEQA